ncbi:NAD(P)-dependent oxidoreductase [Kitasatospora sp. NPDC006697]|uniref:NAD(P)-dependent oxidoreductase n=1 Tax=Kitasatospora sp. NPDC006697 TaxID=3364020 RepID=UPI0036CA5135
MKLTILAASGGIGRHLLDQALAAGHEVTAVVRQPAKLADLTGSRAVQADRAVQTVPAGRTDRTRRPDPASQPESRPESRLLRVVQADLATADAAALLPAVTGADAVLSALGAVGKSGIGVAEHGTLAVLEAMRTAGIGRILVVSAAPIGTVASPARPHPPRHDPGDGFLMRHLLSPAVKRVLRAHYADLARMEDALRASDLEWTSVRPPQLTDRPLTTTYRIALDQNLRGGSKISRASVAHYLLRALDDPSTIGHAVGIAD